MRRRPATGTNRKPPSDVDLAQRMNVPGAQATAVAEPAAPAGADSEDLVRDGMADLQRKFQSLLQEQAGLDPEERAEMAKFFEQSIQDASGSPSGALNEDVFDKATWSDTVELMLKAGTVEQDEADHLIRTINDALAPLECRESKLAIEFNRRMATEGEQRAIEWLRSQSQTTETQAAREPQAVPGSDVRQPVASETINSRSRRLRGPPR